MPRLVLTDDQVAEVSEILRAQSDRRTGFIAVLNFGFDRLTGERIAELSFIALDWQDAAKICRQARKLAEKSAGPVKQINPDRTLDRFRHTPTSPIA